jgi:hypothetical protein
MNKQIKIAFTLPIILIGIALLFNCSATKSVGSSKPLKTKHILGTYELDSLSLSKNFPYKSYRKRLMLNRRHQLLYQTPYPGHEAPPRSVDGKPIIFVTRGNWKKNSDTLFLCFRPKYKRCIEEEVYLIRVDSLIPIDTTNHKVYIKRK